MLAVDIKIIDLLVMKRFKHLVLSMFSL